MKMMAFIKLVTELYMASEALVFPVEAQAARLAGVDLSRRRFKPHVTLVRFPNRLPDYAADRIGAWLASHGDLRLDGGDAVQFSLYRSTLHEDGPIYDALASYPLIP